MLIENLFKQEMESFVPEYEIKAKKQVQILNFLQSYFSGVLKITLNDSSEAFFFFMEGVVLFRGKRNRNRVTEFIFVKSDVIIVIPASFDFSKARFEFSNCSKYVIFPKWINYFTNFRNSSPYKLINVNVSQILTEFGL